MLIRRLKECEEITAADGTRLRELLHPDRDYPFEGHYSLAHATVAPGEKSKPHRLKTDEVYYILQGEGRMHIGDEVATVYKGDVIDIPPDAVQWIENSSDEPLVFLCIVDPAWRADDEAVIA